MAFKRTSGAPRPAAARLPRAAGQGKRRYVTAVLCYILCLCAGVLACRLLLGGVAHIMCRVDIPFRWLVPIATCCAAAATLLGGWLAAALQKKRRLVWGACVGLGSWAVLVCGGLLRSGGGLGALAWIKLPALLCAGVLGSALGGRLHSSCRRPGAMRQTRAKSL